MVPFSLVQFCTEFFAKERSTSPFTVQSEHACASSALPAAQAVKVHVMAVDRDGGQYVAVEYLRRTWKIAVDVEGTLLDAAYSIANATSTAPSTLKLVQGGRACAPLRTPQQSLADSGRYCSSVNVSVSTISARARLFTDCC